MKKENHIILPCFSLLLIISLLNFACTSNYKAEEYNKASISSPDGGLTVGFQLRDGIPFYNIKRGELALLNDSRLGLKLNEIPSFDKDFMISGVEESTFDSSWVQSKSTDVIIRERYNELLIRLSEGSGSSRKMDLIFRVYNDGIRFRYEVPKQAEIEELQLTDELTEFSVANNFDVWWVSAYGRQRRQEYPFRRNKVSELSEAVQLPLTMSYGDSLFLSIHEASLAGYAGMTLVNNGNNTLKCDLVNQPKGSQIKAVARPPLITPWRTIQVTEKPEDLLTSYLIFNLSEQEKLKDALRLTKLQEACLDRLL